MRGTFEGGGPEGTSGSFVLLVGFDDMYRGGPRMHSAHFPTSSYVREEIRVSTQSTMWPAGGHPYIRQVYARILSPYHLER
jgi:hypothetical protein